MERIGSVEIPTDEFTFTDKEVELKEAQRNHEAYSGCLVSVMKAANRGYSRAGEEIATTVVATQGNNLAMACGRCGITMIRDSGVVYGATKCPLVRSGHETLGELA